MIRVSGSVEIQRSVDEVFAFVTDLGNAPKWQRGVATSKRLGDAPVGVGTRFSEQVKMMGKTFETMCEVVEFEPGRRMTMVADGPLLRYRGGFTFAPAGQGTRIELAAELHLKGFWRLLSPLMGGEVRRESQAELDDIKRVLESDSAAQQKV